MKVEYRRSRYGSEARCPSEVIVIDDRSDGEQHLPSEERPTKRECLHGLTESNGGEAPQGGFGARAETSVHRDVLFDIEDCISTKRRQRELFQSAGLFRDGESVVASAPRSRPARRLPPPTRLNYIIHKVTVRRTSASVEELPVTPSTPPDAKALIQSSLLSKLAKASKPSKAQTSSAAPVKVFVKAPWPPRVAYLHDYYNSKGIKLPYVHHFGDCGCDYPCKIDACKNDRMNIFCSDNCCIWEELCANRPRESPKLKVMQDAKTCQYAVVATSLVKAGEVLGEYLGQLRCIPKDPSRRTRNQGCMLSMNVRTDGVAEQCVGIDAQHLGGRMGFANHSCVANAQFFEVANGRRHTVVVVSIQDILPGVEVSVNYGKDLWFVCKCRDTKCVHRDIQDQDDP